MIIFNHMNILNRSSYLCPQFVTIRLYIFGGYHCIPLRPPHDDLSYGDINQQDEGVFIKDVIALNQQIVEVDSASFGQLPQTYTEIW